MTSSTMSSDFETALARHNVARFFVDNRHIAWVLLIGVLAWGIWAYRAMPKRKDPDIPVRQVAVITPWPGQSAERVEQLVTRKVEENLAQNIHMSELKSISRAGLSVVYAGVDERVTDTAKEFDDFKVKLDSLTDLPEGDGPIHYIKEFGETSALMLTLASPSANETQLQLIASDITNKLKRRSAIVDVILCSASGIDLSFLREAADLLQAQLRNQNLGIGFQLIQGTSFVAIRFLPSSLETDLTASVRHIWEGMPQRADIHPDVWDPIVIGPNSNVDDALREHAGAKYSCRELNTRFRQALCCPEIRPKAPRQAASKVAAFPSAVGPCRPECGRAFQALYTDSPDTSRDRSAVPSSRQESWPSPLPRPAR